MSLLENAELTTTPSYNAKRDDEQLRAIAESYDCDLLIPDDKTLYLDLDTIDSYRVFEKNINILGKCMEIEDVYWYNSKSGKGKHVIICLKWELNLIRRLAIQTMLGSDPTKEALSYMREYTEADEIPVALFKPRKEPLTRITEIVKGFIKDENSL